MTLRNLTPGMYVAAIDLYSPEPSVMVPVNVWNLTDRAEGNLTVTPTTLPVTQGTPATLTAAWSGLDASKRYIGQVNYLQGTNVAASTIVTVNP